MPNLRFARPEDEALYEKFSAELAGLDQKDALAVIWDAVDFHADDELTGCHMLLHRARRSSPRQGLEGEPLPDRDWCAGLVSSSALSIVR